MGVPYPGQKSFSLRWTGHVGPGPFQQVLPAPEPGFGFQINELRISSGVFSDWTSPLPVLPSSNGGNSGIALFTLAADLVPQENTYRVYVVAAVGDSFDLQQGLYWPRGEPFCINMSHSNCGAGFAVVYGSYTLY